MEEVDKLEVAYRNARRERLGLEEDKRREVEIRRDAAMAAIHQQVGAQFDERIVDLQNAEHEAEKAWSEAREVAGKKAMEHLPKETMVLWARDRSPGSRTSVLRKTDKRGVLEIRTRETVFAANLASWRKPAIGEIFVRLKKQTGEVGLMIDNYNPQRWLPEGVTPSQD